jgi:hypothetical protein
MASRVVELYGSARVSQACRGRLWRPFFGAVRQENTAIYQTSYIAPLGVTVFDFRLFWGSEPLDHVMPTFIKFDQYWPTFI